MPSPTTTNLPRPKSWDEFEDICADVLKRIWDDPYIVRNGRLGQRQHGVDCYGLPKHLNGASIKKYAGVQCKEIEALTIKVIEEEVEKAKEFKPHLIEYLVMTTAPRDATLQEEVRTKSWPFDHVQIIFWEDISLELSGHDDLLQKHFSGWVKVTTYEPYDRIRGIYQRCPSCETPARMFRYSSYRDARDEGTIDEMRCPKCGWREGYYRD